MMTTRLKSAATLSLAQKRALLAARLRQVASEPRQSPLSYAQQRLWFLDQLEPNSPLYNIGAIANVRGRIDLEVLETALKTIIARHETLRTRFACPEDSPIQIIDTQSEFKLEVVDLANLEEAERETQAKRLLQAELSRPFDLSAEHPLRVTWVKLGSEAHRLVLILHHIVGDEWSLRVLFRELVALYTAEMTGAAQTLPELPIQYADYARWQRQWLQGDILQRQLNYWKTQLKNFPPLTEIPTDAPRPAIPTFNGRTLQRPLGRALSQGLEELARRNEATLFMVLLAAFKVLVHRYTQQEDLIVCSPVAGRNRVETEHLIGFFVNTLALRTNIGDDPSFEQYLARVREAVLGAMTHQDLPFDRVVEELQPERSLNHLPFTKLMFTFQASLPEEIALPGATLQFLEVEPELAKFEITLAVRQTSEGLVASVEYNRDLFTAGTIERLLGHYQTLLESIVASPGDVVSRLRLLTPAERSQLLVDWNRTAREFPRHRCLHELFEEQVARHPDTVAVKWGAQKMTYAELNSRANQLARFLKQFDLKPDTPVGLCVERSLEMVVGIMGILKAGASYVPLDANYPKERLAFMLKDTGTPVVVTQQRLLERVPRNGNKVVCLDADWELIAREQRENVPALANPRNLAYIMYTSGSTGQPKGVSVSHRSVARLVLNTDFIQLDASDRVAQVSNVSFDAATFELWGALLNGAQLVGITRDVALSPKDFADELREQGITTMFLTAALFSQLASEAPGCFENLRTLIAGGEALDPKWVRAVLRNRPPQRLLNGYGPTENTTFTCCHWIRQLPEEATNVPIGRPISNTRVYILDRHLNPVPIGVPGELYAAGDGLARGYWKRPELTAEKFIPDPFDQDGGGRLYRTGDLARYRADGTVEFLGRIDSQVKIRGFRIELGEIETLLGRHPAVKECVVTVTGIDSSSKRLVAYVGPTDGQPLNASDLRAYLTKQLPNYMIPSAFVKVESFPLTPNGKVDRKALPAPDQTRPRLDRQYVAPRDSTEAQLVGIWEAVLGVKPVGVQDKFFDLGGHSMLAVRVIAQIEKTFGRRLRLATLFQAPTIERLAEVLREEVKESMVASRTSLVEIQAAGAQPPLFLVHGAGGGMFWGYINLSRSLGNDQPVYGFKSRGLDGQEEFSSIEELAAHYLADLRKFQPQGPYYLGGYCFGGNVAYEMACQLTEQGEKVALLAVLNCAPPNSRYTKIAWTPGWALKFGRNLLYWANYFRHWSPTQRREFFRWKWQLLQKKIARNHQRLSGDLSSVEPGDLVDLSSYTEDQKRIWESHIRALVHFKPRPYAGKIHLFRSSGHPLLCSFEEDYGWGDLARGGVALVTVAGAHEKILEEPWVRELGESLNQVLRNAGSNAATAPASPAGESRSAVHYIDLFTTRTEPYGRNIAVTFRSEHLTYRQLDSRANQLAHFLQGQGVGPGALVGVALERGLDLPVTLLAILKAGAAYLPLDPDYPTERLNFMADDARPVVVLTQLSLKDRLSGIRSRLICLDDTAQREAVLRCPEQPPAYQLTADSLAYVIYTSGSSGVPKGVEITHGALINHNLAIAEEYRLRADDRVLQFTALSFDVSVEEIFPTWLSGAALVLRTDDSIRSPEHFLAFVAEHQITVLNLPTAYWHELVSFLSTGTPRLPSCVRLVIIGGEAASEEAYRRWKKCVPASVRLVNSYGATEATITSTVYEARPDDDTLAIGRPIANTYAVVLDQQGRLVPTGESGELCLGGAGLARGYLHREELTRRSFIVNPLPGEIPSERLYKTGDLVRQRRDGNLEFIGRLDDQVKVRGYRIELGEVAAALQTHPEIGEAIAVTRKGNSGAQRIVAYYVPWSFPGPRSSNILNFLKKKLPHYMVPSALVPLKEMPLSPAGKIDRQALPAPGTARPNLDQQFVAAASPIENQLAKAWSELLEVEHVGVNDNFIELGGHSLLATRALSFIREKFQVDLSLPEFFSMPTISELARHLTELNGRAPKAIAPPPLLPGPAIPLSALQERLWFLDQLDPSRTAYNRVIVARLRGPLNIQALNEAVRGVLHSHDALRAVFPSKDGRPAQCVLPPSEGPLTLTDLAGQETEPNQALAAVAKEASQPHILSQTVFRPRLLRFNSTDHGLVLTTNQIATDEISVRLVLHEIASRYEEALSKPMAGCNSTSVSPVEAAPPQAVLTEEERKQQLDFWSRELSEVPELLDLPGDRPRPAQGDYSGARYHFQLAESTLRAVSELAASQSADPLAIFLAGFASVLHRYTGNQRFVVGSAVSLRRAGTNHSVGSYENPVALVCDFQGNLGFDEAIRRSAGAVKSAAANAALPFAEVVSTVCPRKSPSFTPIFQVAISVGEELLPRKVVGDVEFSASELDTGTSKLDLTLKLVKAQDGYRGYVEYSSAIFDEERIVRMVQHLRTLLEDAAANPARPVSQLALLPAEELRLVLDQWNATELPYSENSTLIGLFCEQANRTPAAEALVGGETRLTYSELYTHAQNIARHLRSLGVVNGTLVGICLERSAEMVAAMLGTLLAGGAYVPLDPKYPSERLAFSLQDSNCKVLLTQQSLKDLLPHTEATVLCVDGLPPESSSDNIPPVSKPDDLAYLIYTSGSTGKPKGVALEHRNAVSLVAWAKSAFSGEELSGVMASTSICFDLSVFELFVPLCCGGKVILADNALSLPTLPAASEVRLINTVPSAIRELLRLRAVPAGVRIINLAGEPLSAELVDQIYNQTAVTKVFDLYGPTETTTYSTGGLRQVGQPATIGRPLANEQVYLLDANLQPVPVGVPGELFIGGAGVARGYLNRPELTAQKFIANPFRKGARLYRTGDLARWRVDGNLEYLGRIDHQVKIRGFRIELAEIETVLRAQEGVSSTVVLAREDNPGDKRLVAYVAPQTGISLTPENLKQRLRGQLPDFMVPSEYVFLDAMPMTPNGKIDRKALPRPEAGSGSEREVIAPRTELEKQLAAMWREVLRNKQLGITDNFFDLGGHSLLAVRIISAIRDVFGIELPLSALFSTPTISGLAEVLTAALAQKGRSAATAVIPAPRNRPLPLSYVQERLWFLDQLEPGSAAYNVPTALRLKGRLNLEALQQSLDLLVERHEALRTTFKYAGSELCQQISAKLGLKISRLEINGADREERLRGLVDEHARKPFDLMAGPLMRATVFRLDEQDHVLLVVMHHSISDGWSLAVFFQELGEAYNVFAAGKQTAPAQISPIQYADFAHWQRRWMTGAVLEGEVSYWKNLLSGAPGEVALPLDRPRPEQPTGRAGARAIRLDPATVKRIVELNRREGCTPFMFFLTSLFIVLNRWTRQDDLVVGTVVAGRTHRELENLIGCFMNFLPLRARMNETEPARELLKRVRGLVLEAQAHQDCPFEKIVEALRPQRRRDQNPLYNVALLLQNFPPNLLKVDAVEVSPVPVSLETALLDLRFEIEPVADALSITCEYKTDLFEPGTIEGLLDSWLKAIEQIVSAPESNLTSFEAAPRLSSKNQSPEPKQEDPGIVITASFTADPIHDALQFWLRRLDLPTHISFAPYNQVFQQLLDPSSELSQNRHGANVILLRLQDWDHAADRGANGQTPPASSIKRSAEDFIQAVKACANRAAAPLLICFCPPDPRALPSPENSEVLRIEQRVQRELASIAGVYLLSTAEIQSWYPVADYYDSAGDELGHVPYTPVFFTALATALARKVHALKRPVYKVIALDCDNTLWSGICGEEGPQGIQLEPWRQRLQQFMQTQREQGMLLCLCSKNNEEDVRAVFAQRTDFPLKWSDFVAARLNWEPKSANLKSLAQELGLGLDSFIFLDDNPVECAEVQANHPEVMALQLPEDPAAIPQFLNHCWVFDRLKITAEDQARNQQYEQNRLREKLRAEIPTLQGFLDSLELKIELQPVSTAQYSRVAQLTQRTNQFNLTTKRRTENELKLWLNTGEALAVTVRDRFGDYGLVGVMLYQLTGDKLNVDTLLLSCRVLGRGVEYRMLAHLAQMARERGADFVDLHFVPSAKNKPALDFLERIGAGCRQPLNGGTVFRLPVEVAAEAAAKPAFAEPRAKDSAEKSFAAAAETSAAARFELCREIAMEAGNSQRIHQALSATVSVRKRAEGKYAPPVTDLERKLCSLWQELLHVEPVGINDDFFELGGHSLMAVRLFAEIEKIVGRKFPLVTLFQAPTIAQLARLLEDEGGAGSLLVPIQPRGDKPPLFLVHGAGGDVLWGYANLAAHLPSDQPIYGIKSHGQDGEEEKPQLEEMARSYIEVVRSRQPEGPYYLGGYCFGGNVAYEMARQLRMQGQQVALVVLIDTAPANAGYETIAWYRPAFAWRFARNLKYWLSDFMDLKAEERRKFVGRKFRWIGRKLQRRLGFALGPERFDLEEVIDLSHFPQHELNLWQSHLEALIAHIERPYHGRVALLRTRGQALFCSLEDDFCWGKLVPGGVLVRLIPGSHENIFMEPNVRVLASELTGLLEATNAANDPVAADVTHLQSRESVLPL